MLAGIVWRTIPVLTIWTAAEIIGLLVYFQVCGLRIACVLQRLLARLFGTPGGFAPEPLRDGLSAKGCECFLFLSVARFPPLVGLDLWAKCSPRADKLFGERQLARTVGPAPLFGQG